MTTVRFLGRRVLAAAFAAGLWLLGALTIPTAAQDQLPQGVPDATKPGAYAVTTRTYDLGDTAFEPTDFPGKVELSGVVHSPRNARGKKFPMVVFLHGRHETCGLPDGRTDGSWPCQEPFTEIPSYRGYDDVGKLLASHGYFVLSISANGISAKDSEDPQAGRIARGELIQKHLDLWLKWTHGAAGPFGSVYVGAIDFTRIGTMGHSRGGEGIVSQLAVNEQAGRPYGIRAILPLTPTDFFRQVPENVALGTVLGTCDGDLFDLQGAHYFDDARYAAPGDRYPKYQITIAGANHNFFNTVWSPSSGQPGAIDDWEWMTEAGAKGGACAPESGRRLGEEQQRAVGSVLITSFFRMQLGGERVFAGLWEGTGALPRSVASAQLSTTYQAPDLPAKRRDVNRLGSAGDLTTNTLGGAVELEGFTEPGLCGGVNQPQRCLTGEYGLAKGLEPHAYSGRRKEFPGTNVLRLRWDQPGSFRNDLPAHQRDVSAYRSLHFRASVDFSDLRNQGIEGIPLTVRLTDGRGRQASVDASAYGEGLNVPELVTTFDNTQVIGVQVMRRLLLHQVQIPLEDFGSIELSHVRSVEMIYEGAANGAIVVNDLSFSD